MGLIIIIIIITIIIIIIIIIKIIIIIILIIMFIYSASNLKVPAKAHYKSNKKYEKVIKNKNV